MGLRAPGDALGFSGPVPRIFVAIPLPSEIATEIARALPALPSLRPVAPELLHLTLAFVGELADDRVGDVIAATEAAARASAPFPIGLGGIGHFPGHGRPKVVWVGTGAAGEAIERLGTGVRTELARRGVPFDPKPLRAHVTLARVRHEVTAAEGRAIRAAVASARPSRELSFHASGVHVMESRLSLRRPLYSSRAEVPLGLPGKITGPPERNGGPGRDHRPSR